VQQLLGQVKLTCNMANLLIAPTLQPLSSGF
jgi:hypothetical protein